MAKLIFVNNRKDIWEKDRKNNELNCMEYIIFNKWFMICVECINNDK